MQNQLRTPIAIFAYKRPSHFEQLLQSLSLCSRLDECEVNIFCDGAKGSFEQAVVEQSRQVAHYWALRIGATVILQKSNKGLARSIIDGVTELCGTHGRVIILEDDLVVHPAFLDYMLQALDAFHDAEQVYQVGGYMFPIAFHAPHDAVLLPLTSTWGWATWDRAWRSCDWSAHGALEQLQNPDIERRFNLDGSYPYSQMLRDRLAGKNESWGILWWWSVFCRDGLGLYPMNTLIRNNGHDGSGTHPTVRRAQIFKAGDEDVTKQQWSGRFPWSLNSNGEYMRKVEDYLRREGLHTNAGVASFLRNFGLLTYRALREIPSKSWQK